jgi:hypothetical protein
MDVRAGSNPVNRTIVGAAQSGDYALTITLDAIQGGQSVSRLAERIPVTVKCIGEIWDRFVDALDRAGQAGKA